MMMVGEGGATGEGGGASPSGSGFLQSVGVVGRAAHSGVAAATCGGGRAGGTCGGLRRIELQRFDPAEPAVWGVGAGLRRQQGRQARTHGGSFGGAHAWLCSSAGCGWCVARHPASLALLRRGHCSLAPCSGCCASPCAVLMADFARILVLGSGLMGSPSSARSAAIWSALRCVVPAAHAGQPAPPARPKRFWVSGAGRALGWL